MDHPSFFAHKGEQYGLTHLQATQFSLTLQAHNTNPKLKLKINIAYSNHCYTEGVPRIYGAPHDLIDHNNRTRWFSPERHKSSLILPNLVQQLHTKKCHFTGKHNWLIVELQSNTGEWAPFHIYFSIRKNKTVENSLFIRIESAYLKTRGNNSPRRRGSMDRIAFAMLTRKILNGDAVKRPGRR